MEPQFSYPHPVTLVGAAPLDSNLLRFTLNFAPKAIAADGGVNHLRALGVDPLAVVGDMDSVALENLAGRLARASDSWYLVRGTLLPPNKSTSNIFG